MYDKCYFCLDQLPKLKKRIHSKLFRKFWRNRGTKEPAYITVKGAGFSDQVIKSQTKELAFLAEKKYLVLK